jgi:8-oxo-dGTP diphosphatase
LSCNVWKYRFLRQLGRLTVRVAALATLGKMPPMVSACAVIERDGTFLMIRDTAQGRLVLPGGHLHWRERLDEGIKREVREETGYEVDLGELVGAFTSHEHVADRGIVRIAYAGTITGGTARSSAEGGIEWPDMAQLDAEESRERIIIRDWLRSRGSS